MRTSAKGEGRLTVGVYIFRDPSGRAPADHRSLVRSLSISGHVLPALFPWPPIELDDFSFALFLVSSEFVDSYP